MFTPTSSARPAAACGRVDGVATAMQEAPDRVGQRHRAAVRQAGQLLVGADRLEVVRGRGGGHLHQLDRQHPVRADPAADPEELVEMLDRGGGAKGGEGVLHLLGADHLRHVARQQRQPVVGRQLPLPGVGLDLQRLAERVGHAANPGSGVLLLDRGRRRQLEHAAVADDHRGGGAELGHVALAPAHHERHHADRAALRQPETGPLVIDEAVGRGQRLGDRAGRAGREVVVVVALDPLQRLGGGPSQRGVPAGHLGEQEEAPLGAHLGAHRRLPEADQVVRVGGALLAGQQTDAGGQATAHRDPAGLERGTATRPIIGSGHPRHEPPKRRLDR